LKITVFDLSVANSQGIILGDEDDDAAVSGFLPHDTPGFRVVFKIRGLIPDIWDNENSSTEFTLNIYREHDSVESATRFVGTHRHDVGRVVRMEIVSGSQRLLVPRCGIVPSCVWRCGAGTIFQYKCTCSDITTQ
jgi:hypothetical protein